MKRYTTNRLGESSLSKISARTKSVHRRAEHIYPTCWATGSSIDSMILVWNTGIFSVQRADSDFSAGRNKTEMEILLKEAFDGICTHLYTQPRTKMSKSRETTPVLFPGVRTADITITRPRFLQTTLRNKDIKHGGRRFGNGQFFRRQSWICEWFRGGWWKWKGNLIMVVFLLEMAVLWRIITKIIVCVLNLNFDRLSTRISL